ncbi:cell division protein FtsL [Pseudomonas matsuisoli]|uniref:Cell division protein FtsL n=1 Tax=Pseudomonas matsuisoli TaxID=1515666 RepID=A0A917Q2C1_9PSED|nr:cell division protein FtsL [Pseudomonas matsuisoli]GGK07711.1 cell division protein FtsL [Pseudomonas matsuisoli]
MSRAQGKAMPKGGLLIAVLFLCVLVSALGVSYCAHWNRQLLNNLYSEMSARDKVQAEWGRLVLEQSTWTAHNRIEMLANEKLNMHVPAATDIKLVAP